MTNQDLEATVNIMNDTFLEDVINAHYDQTDENVEAVNNVISYRKMIVPLQIEIKDYHYATMLRKTGSLPEDILYNEDYCEIRQFYETFNLSDGLKMSFLVVLTRASKFDKRMGKVTAMAAMDLREIYERYLEGNDYIGIIIIGGDNPYPISTERIEEILNINK